MGGTAFEIPIEVDEQTFRRATIPSSSLFGRLFGRRKPPPQHGACLDMAIRVPQVSQVIRDSLSGFIAAAIPQPWPATRWFLNTYPWFRKPPVEIWGARDDSGRPTGWRINLGFSGCAGVTETSALLAVHWAEIWYSRERERLAETLRPHGLKPEGEPGRWDPVGLQFLPAGGYGYALFQEREPEEKGESRFELDDSSIQAHGRKETEGLLAALDGRFAAVFADGRCRCQLCMPEFDIGAVEEVIAAA